MKKLLRFLKPRVRVHLHKNEDGWSLELNYRRVSANGNKT